jgi:hypothetical protein
MRMSTTQTSPARTFSDADLTEAWFPVNAAIPEGWAVDPGSGRLARTDVDAGDNVQGAR